MPQHKKILLLHITDFLFYNIIILQEKLYFVMYFTIYQFLEKK